MVQLLEQNGIETKPNVGVGKRGGGGKRARDRGKHIYFFNHMGVFCQFLRVGSIVVNIFEHSEGGRAGRVIISYKMCLYFRVEGNSGWISHFSGCHI